MNYDDKQKRIEDWEQDPQAPRKGWTNLQNTVSFFIPERHKDGRIINVRVGVEYVGSPGPNNAGVYRISECSGFEHIIGNMFSMAFFRIEGD